MSNSFNLLGYLFVFNFIINVNCDVKINESIENFCNLTFATAKYIKK